jgi:hypothetical protein
VGLVEEVALVAAQREVGEGIAPGRRHQALRLTPLTIAARGAAPRRPQKGPGESRQNECAADSLRGHDLAREVAARHGDVLADHAPGGLAQDLRPGPGETRARGVPDLRGAAVAEDDGQADYSTRDGSRRPARGGHRVELRAPVPQAEQQHDGDERRRHVDVPQYEQNGGGGAERNGRYPGAVLPAGESACR